MEMVQFLFKYPPLKLEKPIVLIFFLLQYFRTFLIFFELPDELININI